MTNEINVNQDVVLMPSQTISSTSVVSSSDQNNPYWRGCVIYLNISQASGTGGLGINLQYKDPVSGNYDTVWQSPTAKTTVGLFCYLIYPSTGLITDTGGAADAVLPRTWRIQIAPQDSSTYTFSVGASMIK
ncbi:MAG TPA: hypothetical protein VMF69_08225 [Gemmataceae bacterium]|nr:hypothetical protein [Gemmataceae bacterium]